MSRRDNEVGPGPLGLRDDEAQYDENDPLNLDTSLNEDAREQLLKARWRRFGRNPLKCSRRSCIIFGLVAFALLLLTALGGTYVYKTDPADGLSPPWYPTPLGGSDKSWEDAYRKASRLVKKMGLIEKVNVTTGTGWQMGLCVGNTAPATNVGFPSLCLQDGPLGIRFADQITAFPAGITVGATWNRELMYKRGRAHGLEARLKGVNVLLGPAMGPLGKLPAGGRNWEGFGSDPFLQAIAAAQTIKGIQDEGVIATAKHYIGNEQEHFRKADEWGLHHALSANIDDRTLHEVYLWPFAESVRAGVGSIMCSYQMVNNSYACGNSKLLNGILKDELGFQGFVQSDWLAQRGGVSSALAGLDVTMPGDGLMWADGDSLWGSKLTMAVLNGSLPISRLNDMVTRVVAAWYQLHQDDKALFPPPPPQGNGGPNFSSWTREKIGLLHHGSGEGPSGVVNQFVDVQGKGENSHALLAREVAVEAIALVKNNDNILPLDPLGWKKGDQMTSRKFNVGIYGEDAGPGKGPNACADRGCNQGTLGSGWGSGSVEFPYLVTPEEAIKRSFNLSAVEVTSVLTNGLSGRDLETVAQQDLCFVSINADAGEGPVLRDGVRGDRGDLYAQKGGDELVTKVATRCGNGAGHTVVVIHSVGPVLVENWVDLEGVKAVLFAHLPGQQSGNALADVLFGRANPSGKLPYTVGRSLKDYGEGGQVVYYPNGVIPQQNFNERMFIDYRHFDGHGISPRYEFGFGLSYTSFSLYDLQIRTLKAKSPLPHTRQKGIPAPTYDESLPPPSSALLPSGFHKLYKYVYPYIASESDIKPGDYPYPDGYTTHQHPSAAGGGPGGNPSLWDEHVSVKVKIMNAGPVVGSEVVQLYLTFPSNVQDAQGNTIDFPPRVLRGFEKIELRVHEAQTVEFTLTRKDLSYWSVVEQNWVIPTSGRFTVHVGHSSRRLPLKGIF